MSNGRWLRLSARVLRPERPRLAEARAIVAGLGDVTAAWAALAARGLVPEPAADERRWVYRAAPREPASHWRVWVPGRGVVELPGSVDDAVALAADPDGLVRAGLHAVEAMDRLARCVPAVRPRQWNVAWHVLEPGWTPEPISGFDAAVRRAGAGVGARAAWRTAEAAIARRGEIPTQVVATAAACAAWQRSAEEGSVRAEDNPFEPMVAVWTEGYGIERVEGAVLVLAAPGL